MKLPSDSETESSPRLLDRFFNLIEAAPGSDKLLLRLAFFAIVATGIWSLFALNHQYSETTPTRGGSIVEGIIGTPRFVNPALALTRADQDVTALVYSGLMKIAPNGTLINDVADSVTVSDDGLTYNVTLRRDVTFHDGSPLTAHDVAYTIRLFQDPDLKSPLRGNWTDIGVEEIGEYELNIILQEAYAPFIENFTFGIMPAHLWSSLPIEQLPFSQLNTEPIGSGPFAVTDAKRDASGLINQYSLTAYRGNVSDPKIDQLQLSFYQNEEQLHTALSERAIDATAYVQSENISDETENGYRLIEEPLPRTFGIFFNQNHSAALRDAAAREALSVALNRGTLIETALHDHGVPINGPTPFTLNTLESDNVSGDTATNTPAERAIEILTDNGWTKNNLGLWEKKINKEAVTLSVTLRTSNTPLFESLVNSIAKQWEAVGVEVTTEQFEQTGLVQSVIRPRDFQALLFGLDMSRSHDLYPFWHSSQQDDPGLNIAQYANVEVDNLLETARSQQDNALREDSLRAASTIITKEHPAIFLFQPTFTYLVDPEMTVTDINNIGKPADRFSNISDWHTESESLWPLFRDDNM